MAKNRLARNAGATARLPAALLQAAARARTRCQQGNAPRAARLAVSKGQPGAQRRWPSLPARCGFQPMHTGARQALPAELVPAFFPVSVPPPVKAGPPDLRFFFIGMQVLIVLIVLRGQDLDNHRVVFLPEVVQDHRFSVKANRGQAARHPATVRASLAVPGVKFDIGIPGSDRSSGNLLLPGIPQNDLFASGKKFLCPAALRRMLLRCRERRAPVPKPRLDKRANKQGQCHNPCQNFFHTPYHAEECAGAAIPRRQRPPR